MNKAITNLRDIVGGTIFAVTFVKRSTGEVREMQCRFGVKSHLQGGEAAYNPKDKDLLWVFSVDSDGYRSIPYEGIIRIVGMGRTIYENKKLAKAHGVGL